MEAQPNSALEASRDQRQWAEREKVVNREIAGAARFDQQFTQVMGGATSDAVVQEAETTQRVNALVGNLYWLRWNPPLKCRESCADLSSDHLATELIQLAHRAERTMRANVSSICFWSVT